jgi:hypothetical protein
MHPLTLEWVDKAEGNQRIQNRQSKIVNRMNCHELALL